MHRLFQIYDYINILDKRPPFVLQLGNSIEAERIKHLSEIITKQINRRKTNMSKEVNVQLVKDAYSDLLTKKQQAIETELLNKPALVQERLQAVALNIDEEIEAELIAKASEPFAEKIALLETFLYEQTEETDTDESNQDDEQSGG